jgi:hypothetical protein
MGNKDRVIRPGNKYPARYLLFLAHLMMMVTMPLPIKIGSASM